MTTLKRGQGTAVGDLEGHDLRLWWMSFHFLSLVVNLVNLIELNLHQLAAWLVRFFSNSSSFFLGQLNKTCWPLSVRVGQIDDL